MDLMYNILQTRLLISLVSKTHSITSMQQCMSFIYLHMLVGLCYLSVEDLALDWINNKLYWTESVHRRIEVLDLDTMYRTPLINAAPHTGLRSIVVDPLMKYVLTLTHTVIDLVLLYIYIG